MWPIALYVGEGVAESCHFGAGRTFGGEPRRPAPPPQFCRLLITYHAPPRLPRPLAPSHPTPAASGAGERAPWREGLWAGAPAGVGPGTWPSPVPSILPPEPRVRRPLRRGAPVGRRPGKAAAAGRRGVGAGAGSGGSHVVSGSTRGRIRRWKACLCLSVSVQPRDARALPGPGSSCEKPSRSCHSQPRDAGRGTWWFRARRGAEAAALRAPRGRAPEPWEQPCGRWEA